MAAAWINSGETTTGLASELHGQATGLSAVWRDDDGAAAFEEKLQWPVPMLDQVAQTQAAAAAALQAYAAALEQAQQSAIDALAAAQTAQTSIINVQAEMLLAGPTLAGQDSSSPVAPGGAGNAAPIPGLADFPNFAAGPTPNELLAQGHHDLAASQQSAGSIASNVAVAAARATAALTDAAAELAKWQPASRASVDLAVANLTASSPAWGRYNGSFLPTHPISSASPAAAAALWRDIPQDLQGLYIQRYPEIVGNTDGIPTVDRDRANRISLAAMLPNLNRQLAAMGPQPPLVLLSGARSNVSFAHDAWQFEHDALVAKIDGLNQLASRLTLNTPDTHYLIGLKPDGQGLGIVATGNPDEASNVSILGPGNRK